MRTEGLVGDLAGDLVGHRVEQRLRPREAAEGDACPNCESGTLRIEKAIEVGTVEDEGDTVYQLALRRLFSDEEDASGKYAVTWLRIFDRMELCLDACDRVSGIVRDIIMKDA